MTRLGAVIVIVTILAAVFGPSLVPFDPAEQQLPLRLEGPTGLHWFGLDELGRDIFARVLYGARISLGVAFVGPLVAMSIGLIVGVISGYLGGRIDNYLMRFVDIMYAFPTYLLIILLMAFFRTSFTDRAPGTLAYTLGQLDAGMGGLLFVFIGIGLTSWMGMARLARSQVLSVRQSEYVQAAKASVVEQDINAPEFL